MASQAGARHQIADRLVDLDREFIDFLVSQRSDSGVLAAGAVVVFSDPDDAVFSAEAARLAILNRSLSRAKRELARPAVLVTPAGRGRFRIEPASWEHLAELAAEAPA
jgi:hypothetical protein